MRRKATSYVDRQQPMSSHEAPAIGLPKYGCDQAMQKWFRDGILRRKSSAQGFPRSGRAATATSACHTARRLKVVLHPDHAEATTFDRATTEVR